MGSGRPQTQREFDPESEQLRAVWEDLGWDVRLESSIRQCRVNDKLFATASS